MGRKRIGELLVERFGIEPEEVKEGLDAQQASGMRLGEALVLLGSLPERDLVRALAHQLGIPIALGIASYDVPSQVLRLVPRRMAERSDIMPLATIRSPAAPGLVLAMADPTRFALMADLERLLGMEIFPVISPLADIRLATGLLYDALEKADRTPPASRGFTLVDENTHARGAIPLQPFEASSTVGTAS